MVSDKIINGALTIDIELIAETDEQIYVSFASKDYVLAKDDVSVLNSEFTLVSNSYLWQPHTKWTGEELNQEIKMLLKMYGTEDVLGFGRRIADDKRRNKAKA